MPVSTRATLLFVRAVKPLSCLTLGYMHIVGSMHTRPAVLLYRASLKQIVRRPAACSTGVTGASSVYSNHCRRTAALMYRNN